MTVVLASLCHAGSVQGAGHGDSHLPGAFLQSWGLKPLFCVEQPWGLKPAGTPALGTAFPILAAAFAVLPCAVVPCPVLVSPMASVVGPRSGQGCETRGECK